MHFGFGKSRIFGYILIGVVLGTFLQLAHDLLEHYFPGSSDWVQAVVLIPILAAGLALLAHRENALYAWGRRMDDARRRLNGLVLAAVAQKRREHPLEDAGLATCWQELDCDQRDCPVYGREHARCWLIAGTFCRGEVQGQFAKKIKDCRLCRVYQHASADPVREITENFIAMNYLLGEREEQLEQALGEARDHSAKLAGLVTLSEAALSSVHLSEVLKSLLESAASFAGADLGFISTLDPVGEQLAVRATYGLDPGMTGKLAARVGEGIVGRAFAGGYIAVSEDLAVDGRFAPPELRAVGTRTLISLPLVAGGKPLGMMTLGTFSPHHYTEEERDSLSVAADRVAAVVERSSMASELSRDRDLLGLMDAISKDLGTRAGVSGIYASMIEHAARIVGFDSANLMAWHPQAGEFEVIAASTRAAKTWLDRGLRLPADAVAAGRVIESGRALLRDDITGDEFPADKLLADEGIRSSLVVPLRSNGEIRGVVNLGSFEANAYRQKDLELLEPVVRQLSLVLDNARLLEEVKRRSLVDNLTGLYNHRYFCEAAGREIARGQREGRPVSVIFIGIDGLGGLIMSGGQLAADRKLVAAGRILRASIRQIDIVSRYGSDQFALLLPGLSADQTQNGQLDAVRIVERLRPLVATEIDAGERPELGVSIGIAEYPAHAEDVTGLLERAGWALREARENRGTVVARKVDWGAPAQKDTGAG